MTDAPKVTPDRAMTELSDVEVMTDSELIRDYADCIRRLVQHEVNGAIRSVFGSGPDQEQIRGWTDLIHERYTELLRRLTATERPAADDTVTIRLSVADARFLDSYLCFQLDTNTAWHTNYRKQIEGVWRRLMTALSAASDGEPTDG